VVAVALAGGAEHVALLWLAAAQYAARATLARAARALGSRVAALRVLRGACGAADKPPVQLPRWEIHPSEISIQSVLGRGASGQVYLARLRVRWRPCGGPEREAERRADERGRLTCWRSARRSQGEYVAVKELHSDASFLEAELLRCGRWTLRTGAPCAAG